MLVTGAGGFLGANLIRRLIGDGHTVTGLVRPGSDGWRLDGVSGAELRSVDLRDPDAVREAISGASPQWVFHLAAHGGYSWQTDAAGIFQSNVVGTATLLDGCREAGCEAFVQTGSSSEYGLKDHAPREDEALEPNSAYAVAKAAATMYARHLAASSGFPAITLRLYSAYGPYEDPRRLVPTLLAHGLQGRLPPLVNPQIARDFVATDDVLDALIAAAERPSAAEPGAVYNVGSGVETTIGEIVEVVRELLEIEVEPDWGSAPQRDWDTTSWVSDSRKIREKLGWAPRVALRDGLRQMCAWLRETPQVWERYGISAPDARERRGSP